MSKKARTRKYPDPESSLKSLSERAAEKLAAVLLYSEMAGDVIRENREKGLSLEATKEEIMAANAHFEVFVSLYEMLSGMAVSAAQAGNLPALEFICTAANTLEAYARGSLFEENPISEKDDGIRGALLADNILYARRIYGDVLEVVEDFPAELNINIPEFPFSPEESEKN